MSNLNDIQNQIAELQAKADALKAEQSDEKLASIKADIAAFGFTQDQVFGGKKLFADKPVKTAPIKYRGPQGESWTGRGLAPKWLSTLVAQGHSKEQYLLA